jgi:replicative DNA helicase
MAIVPSLDLRAVDKSASSDAQLAHLATEQGLIGAILASFIYEEGKVCDLFGDSLKPEHFLEPFHGRFYRKLMLMHADGLHAVERLGDLFRKDPAWVELGGMRYVADMIDRAPPSSAATDLAAIVVERFNRRRLKDLAAHIADLADNDSEKGPAEIVDAIEAEVLEIQRSDTRLELTSLDAAADRVMARMVDKTSTVGLDLGLKAIRDITGPWFPSEVVVIGGRPGMGKSALVSNLALRWAAPTFWRSLEHREGDDALSAPRQIPEPVGVIFISEMTEEQMARRMISDIGFALYGVAFPTYQAIRNQRVNSDQEPMMANARETLRGWPIDMIKRTGLKPSQVRSMARRRRAEWARKGLRLGAVVVDHVGLMEADGKAQNRYESQTRVSVELKGLGDDLGCPVVELIQLGRGVDSREDKRPQLSDLKDSGAFEQDADVVLFPFRDSYYAEREKDLPEGSPSSKESEAWATQDARRRSKWTEIIPGKVREGSAAFATKIYTEIAHNAYRDREPPLKGLFD